MCSKGRIQVSEDEARLYERGHTLWHSSRVVSGSAHRGRNPQADEKIVLDAKIVMSWKFSLVLKTAVNGTGKGTNN
jgi:hypothetical protein